MAKRMGISTRSMVRYVPTITAPRGTYRGRWNPPGGPGAEPRLIKELADQVRGIWEVKLICGRADVATDTDVFEVEPLETWRQGLQQVLAYAQETGLHPNLALFGSARGVLDIYLTLRDRMSGSVQLWVHEGVWQSVTNRHIASRRIYYPGE